MAIAARWGEGQIRRMGNLFRSARLKIDRANKHIADIEAIAISVPDRDLVSTEIDPETGTNSIKHVIPGLSNILDEIALIAGDAIHNLRSALDHAWIETFQHLGIATTDYTKFPLLKESRQVEGALRDRQIDTIKPALFNCMMSRIKPYPRGNYMLHALHDLDILDKHKVITAVAGYGNVDGIRVKNHRGESIVGNSWSFLTTGDPIYFDFPPDHEIQDQGKHTIAVLFENPSPLGGLVVLEELKALSHLVVECITLIEHSLA